jgi:hypothetical protein
MNLFEIKILSFHNSREEALIEELKLHVEYDVVNSEDYMNESKAMVNGFFGRDVSGKNHPMWGKKHSLKTREKLSIARRKRITKEETRLKISNSNKGKKLSDDQKRRLSEINSGKKLSEETRKKISESKTGSIPWNKGLMKDIILQIDSEDNIIKEWYNLNDLEIHGFQKSNVINVCLGKRKSHRGFKWCYKNNLNE